MIGEGARKLKKSIKKKMFCLEFFCEDVLHLGGRVVNFFLMTQIK